MKKLLLSFFLFTFYFGSAQWVSIPDTNFGMWLDTSGYSTCMQGNNQIGWQMDTTCAVVMNAVKVSCRASNITNLTGIEYFNNLDTLWCNNNQLTWLPGLPENLRRLDCYNNQLTSLPTLNNSLTYLICSNNLLTVLPSLPDSLRMLSCWNNFLTSLPVLPPQLSTLTCFNNQLTSLPALPDFLVILQCSNNQLNSLPLLPILLDELSCSDNQLSALPALPFSLNRLSCNNNQLTTLPELPDTLLMCYVHNNPIMCLPRLKVIDFLNFTNTNVTCIPNYGIVSFSSPPLNSLLLCDLFNSNGCEGYWNIAGMAYRDANLNCAKDTNEVTQSNIKVELWKGGNLVQQTFTGGEGFFSFDTDSFATYQLTVDTTNSPFYVTCPVNNLYFDTITSTDSIAANRDFATACKAGFDLTAWSVVGNFRPGVTSNVNVRAGDLSAFHGIRCATGISGTVTVTINGYVTYISNMIGALTPSVSGNMLTYNIADFGSVNFFSDFNIIVQTDTTAPLNSQVCFTVSVTPTAGDNNAANNVLTHCFTVVGSFDPNDKTAYPAGDIDTAQEWLTYTIRFQNTGTAEAQHIYITDTLDSDLDVSSFQLLAYSHQPMVQLKENAVRFNFPNINLTDSNTNESLSHGYVQYKIKLKDNLPIGTAINNTAFIYFDFNAPVVTNTTTNTIAVISGIAASHEPLAVRIYPNPASDAVTISIDEDMIGATAIITDIMGRKIAVVRLTIRHSLLTTRDFTNGVYFVSVMGKQGRSVTKKLVINK